MSKESKSDKKIRRLEKTIKMGKLKFSIYSGLVFLIAMSLSVLLYSVCFNRIKFLSYETLLICGCYGIAIALFNYFKGWNQTEKKYKKMVQLRDKQIG